MQRPEEKKLLEELRSCLEKSPFVMLGMRSDPGHDEPMTAKFDAESYPHSLYFFTYTDNRLMRALGQTGPEAVATYMSKDHEVFASLYGKIRPSRDRSLIDRFWSSGVEAWFDKGKDDPSLELLRFDITHAEIWKADVSVAGKLKLMFGGDVRRDDFQNEHANTPL